MLVCNPFLVFSIYRKGQKTFKQVFLLKINLTALYDGKFQHAKSKMHRSVHWYNSQKLQTVFEAFDEVSATALKRSASLLCFAVLLWTRTRKGTGAASPRAHSPLPPRPRCAVSGERLARVRSARTSRVRAYVDAQVPGSARLRAPARDPATGLCQRTPAPPCAGTQRALWGGSLQRCPRPGAVFRCPVVPAARGVLFQL